MGGQRSRPITAAEREKLILERLRSFKVEDGETMSVRAVLKGRQPAVGHGVQPRRKDGLVPQALYPDSGSAMDSAALNAIVMTKLRECALRKLTVERLGNVVGGRDVTYVNVEMATLKAACIKILKEGLPVFFGCDVGKFSDREAGITDLDLFDYEAGLDMSLRLMTGESLMTGGEPHDACHDVDGGASG